MADLVRLVRSLASDGLGRPKSSVDIMSSSEAAARPSISRDGLSRHTRRTCVAALRVAPWVVFGPITGFMCERAFRSYRDGHVILAGLYVTLNILTLIAIPTLTAYLAARLHV